jgi:hypothetical protein
MDWKKLLNTLVPLGANIASSLTGVSSISAIPSVIYAMENAFKGGSGPAKKQAVMETVLISLAVAEGLSKKDLIANEAFMDALDRCIDDFVVLENAIHWKKPIVTSVKQS